MLRKSAVAGSFYPADPHQLDLYIDQILDSAGGISPGEIKGLIVPHAGYVYSAPVAATAYRQLRQFPDKNYNIFLLGPAHFSPATAAVGLFEAFETPLGKVPVNQQICRELLDRNPELEVNPEAHLPEHSLEVQLPFLQKALKNFQIIPILLGDVSPRQITNALSPYFSQKNSLFIFSSDLSHYHPYDEAEELDRQTLKILLERNLPQAYRLEACGDKGLTVAMQLAEKFNCRIQLLDYRNSGDTAGDKKAVVGYAACAITQSPE
jgi:AmmeMemoRadiSam system protein B